MPGWGWGGKAASILRGGGAPRPGGRGGMGVAAPPPLSRDHERFSRAGLRPGNLAAHASARLPLLPSGPDGVHRLTLRETWPSTPSLRGILTIAVRGRGFSPARADSGDRAPLAPRPARPR